MTDDELLQRLQRHEDQFTERKPAMPARRELRQTLSAFTNSLDPGATAVLFIGIHDKTGAAIDGVDPDRIQKLVRQVAEQDCYPPIMTVTCRALSIDGKHVVAVLVGASLDGPHFTGPAYVRRGPESVAASALMYQKLIDSRHDKTARILRMRGKPVSALCVGRPRGDHKPLRGALAQRMGALLDHEYECWIEDCDTYQVRLNIPATSGRAAEPKRPLNLTIAQPDSGRSGRDSTLRSRGSSLASRVAAPARFAASSPSVAK